MITALLLLAAFLIVYFLPMKLEKFVFRKTKKFVKKQIKHEIRRFKF